MRDSIAPSNECLKCRRDREPESVVPPSYKPPSLYESVVPIEETSKCRPQSVCDSVERSECESENIGQSEVPSSYKPQSIAPTDSTQSTEQESTLDKCSSLLESSTENSSICEVRECCQPVRQDKKKNDKRNCDKKHHNCNVENGKVRNSIRTTALRVGCKCKQERVKLSLSPDTAVAQVSSCGCPFGCPGNCR